MSMCSPGDSPLRDLLHWNLPSEYPADITAMLLRLKKEFPAEIDRLPSDAACWCRPENAAKGRDYLLRTLMRLGVDTGPYRSHVEDADTKNRGLRRVGGGTLILGSLAALYFAFFWGWASGAGAQIQPSLKSASNVSLAASFVMFWGGVLLIFESQIRRKWRDRT